MIKKKSAKELLGESLEELLKSKSFDKITVNEIAENCGIGRRTFYNNFIDKYDLATWLYIRQLNEFIENREQARLTDFIKYTTEIVTKDLKIIIALSKYKGQNSFRDSLADPMIDVYIRMIAKYFDCNMITELKQDIEFYVSGQITYVSRVIREPAIPTSEEATEIFIRCIPESLKRFL